MRRHPRNRCLLPCMGGALSSTPSGIPDNICSHRILLTAHCRHFPHRKRSFRGWISSPGRLATHRERMSFALRKSCSLAGEFFRFYFFTKKILDGLAPRLTYNLRRTNPLPLALLISNARHRDGIRPQVICQIFVDIQLIVGQWLYPPC